MKTQRAIWRRRVVRVALCIVLGAVTTVGVAWGCAVRGEALAFPRHWKLTPITQWDETVGWYAARPYEEVPWLMMPPTGWPSTANYRGAIANRRLTYRKAQAGHMLNGGDLYVQENVQSGWPARAMQVTWHLEAWVGTHGPPSKAPIARSWLERGLQTESLKRAARFQDMPLALPMLPVLPGFLLDTLFYAVPWWALLATPGLIKRWRRKRRGACVACGYDLRGLPGGTVLRTVTDEDGGDDIKGEKEDTARRAVPPKCPECGGERKIANGK